ncbi:MAG: hypothetical protein ACT4P5_23345 [Armatimonadota bacterium]
MSKLAAGVVAGLIAGVIFGMGMHMMTAPTPDGGRVPMMAMVAQIVKSDSLASGWLYHLFNSAVIGGIFGLLLGSRPLTYGSGLLWGGLYGVAWWILGGLILMPGLLGMPAFAPLMMEPMRPVAWGSLMGHLVYGLILGAGCVWLSKSAPVAGAAQRIPAGPTKTTY